MTIRLIDIQAGFGGVSVGISPRMVTKDEYLAAMTKLSIEGALVHTTPDTLDIDVELSNRMLLAACRESPQLIPCPVIVPAGGADLPSEACQVDEFIAAGAAATRLRPKLDRWEILPEVSDPLFATLSERSLPSLVFQADMTWGDLATTTSRFPGLRVILCGVPYGSMRILLPILKSRPNIHLSIGNPFADHVGIEYVIKHIGAERILFGTGFPASEPAMAITQLLYAGISDADKQLIGFENFNRLRKEIKS